jgi:hypothetical protein
VTVLAGNAGNNGLNTELNNGGLGGAGGNIAGLTLTATDIATLSVTAGNGGNGANGVTGNAANTVAAAGTAAVILGANAIEATTINVTGGTGGDSGNTTLLQVGDAGSTGGAATLSLAHVLTGQSGIGSTTINITGGNAGTAGTASATTGGTAGAAGGAATVTMTGATSSANIALDNGTANGASAGGIATIAFNAAHTLTGDITAAADGEGAITVDTGALTIDGSVGTATNEVNTLVASTAVTTNNNLYIEDIDMNAAVALTLNGTTAKTVSGALYSTSGNGLITTGANSNWTFNGAVGTTSAGVTQEIDAISLIAASTTAAFNSTVKAATLTTSGTGTVTFNDRVTLTGALTVAQNSTITLGSGIVAGETAITTTAAGFTTAATVNMPQTFNNGTITLIDTSTAVDAAVDAALLTINNNVLTTYTAGANASDASKLDILAVRKTDALVATELNITTSQASALNNAATALASGDATGLAAMNTILAAGVTQDNVEQLQPDVVSSFGAALSSVNATNKVIAGRQAIAFNALGGQSGVSTGDAANDLTVWAQIFGSNANQDAVGTMDGYDADSAGQD